MPNITLKNIPSDLYKALKQNAEINHRSLNREIIASIERALAVHSIPLETVLQTAKTLRAKTAAHPITDAELSRAKARMLIPLFSTF